MHPGFGVHTVYDRSMRNLFLTAVIGLTLVVTSPQVLSAIYKSVDENGNTVFSDSPPDSNAEKIELGPINTIPAPDLPARRNNPDEPTARDSRYETFEITRPQPDESIRSNAGNISIALKVAPAIDRGANDQIVITMDGREIARGTQTSINLDNVPRGSHTLNAVIVSSNGKKLATANSVEFHVLRVTVPKPQVRTNSP